MTDALAAALEVLDRAGEKWGLMARRHLAGGEPFFLVHPTEADFAELGDAGLFAADLVRAERRGRRRTPPRTGGLKP